MGVSKTGIVLQLIEKIIRDDIRCELIDIEENDHHINLAEDNETFESIDYRTKELTERIINKIKALF